MLLWNAKIIRNEGDIMDKYREFLRNMEDLFVSEVDEKSSKGEVLRTMTREELRIALKSVLMVQEDLTTVTKK